MNITQEQLDAIRRVCDDAAEIEASRECHECGGRGWLVRQSCDTCDECDGTGKVSLYDAFKDDLWELADQTQGLVDKCLALRAAMQ